MLAASSGSTARRRAVCFARSASTLQFAKKRASAVLIEQRVDELLRPEAPRRPSLFVGLDINTNSTGVVALDEAGVPAAPLRAPRGCAMTAPVEQARPCSTPR